MRVMKKSMTIALALESQTVNSFLRGPFWWNDGTLCFWRMEGEYLFIRRSDKSCPIKHVECFMEIVSSNGSTSKYTGLYENKSSN